MRPVSKFLVLVAAISGLILIVASSGRLGIKWARPEPALPAPTPPLPEQHPLAPPKPRTLPEQRTGVGALPEPAPTQTPEMTNQIVAASSPTNNLVTDWEDRVGDILGSDADDSAKARRMLEMFPRLPEAGQVAVAQHLANLLPDDAFAPLGKILTDPTQPEGVLDVVLADVLNRGNALKLPLLLEVARAPEHPRAIEAKQLLEVYLEADYGQQWNKWQSRIETWLKEIPH